SQHRDPGSCSSTCSNSAEEQVKSGRCCGNWLKARIEIDRFGGFWTRVLRVRDHEARVQIPGPRPFLHSKPAISDVVRCRRVTARSQFPGQLSQPRGEVVTVVGRI